MFVLQETTDFNLWEKEITSQNKVGFSPGQFHYSPDWNLFQKKIGQNPRFFLIKNQHQKTVGRAVFLIKKPLPLLQYAYCPFGPDLDYKQLKAEELNQIFNLFAERLKKERCLFIRFNPPIPQNVPLNIPNLCLATGKTQQPSTTSFLALDQESHELLAKMKPKTRYNIRLAQKKNLVIQKGVDSKLIQDFWQLSKITGSRNEFGLHSKNYYQNMVDVLGPQKKLLVYLAYHQQEPLAAILLVRYQKTVTYLHGASANKHRNWMAPYLLQWEAIQDAVHDHFLYYDFWGIDSDKWPGVTRFKKGFNGQELTSHPTYDLPINLSAYRFYQKIHPLAIRTKKALSTLFG